MAIFAISAATFLYILCAIDNFKKGDYPHSLTWFAYSLANLGLLWYEYEKYFQNNADT
jgi:hypothetical protein